MTKVQIVYSAIKFPRDSFSTRLIDEGTAVDGLSTYVLSIVLVQDFVERRPEDRFLADVYVGGQLKSSVSDLLGSN